MSLKSSKKLEEANKFELEVAVDGDVFKNAVNKVYKKQVKNINIPGFRKGKAPKQVVERMYGKEVFYDDAMQECYPEALADASKEAEIKIVAVDKLETVEAGDDGFTFKASVIVEPEVEVTDYNGIEVEKKSTEVTDELINEEIEKVRDRNSRMITVEDRAAENGDIAVIDFEGFVDGVAFEGGKAENYNLKLGDGQFIPGFEEQIIGHKTDEEFSINVTFPEDYQAEDLKGKDAEFKIKLHEIKVKELPEVDDEFVKDVSEKETLEEYKEELSEQIKTRLENEADRDLDNQLIDKIIENTKGEIPEAMYDNQVNDMLKEFEMRLRSQGMDLNTYLKYTGMDADSVSKMYRPEAEKRVKLRLALQAIAKNENLEAEEKDIEDEYSRLAEAYKMDVEKVKDAISSDGLAEDIKVDKAMKFVRDNAKTK